MLKNKRAKHNGMEFKVADTGLYAQILALYEQVILTLEQDGINIYWDLDTYPSREYFAKAIDQKRLYVAIEGGRVIGAAVLDQNQRPEYASVPWGCRAGSDEVLVMHVLGILPEARGRGVARWMLERSIDVCRETGMRALLLDALSSNRPACELYRRAGFRCVSEQVFCIPGAGDTDFEVFEYVISAEE